MYIYIVLYSLVFLFIYYLYNLYDRAHFIVENFDDKYGQNEYYKDSYDKEIVNFYNIIYKDDKSDEEVIKYLEKELGNNTDPKILIVGCGKGSLLEKVKKKYNDTHGLDRSENMLKKCQENHPYIKTIKADISKPNLFENNIYDVILFDEHTLNHNNKINMEKVLKNIKPYLKKNGFLFIPIYEDKYLQPRPRYYTTNYLDNEKNMHGFTYINNFSHDAYYVKYNKEKNGYNYDYFDKIVLKDGSYRIKKTRLYIPDKELKYEIFLTNGYGVKKIYSIDDFSNILYEVAIFKKGSPKVNVTKNDANLND